MTEGEGTGYETLQTLLDRTLKTAGLDNTIALLQRFLSQVEDAPKNNHVRRTMREVVTEAVVREFDIDLDNLNHGEAREYKEARMVVFHLLFHYGKYTYGRIGEIYGGRPKHSVRYYTDRCEGFLLIPRRHKLFCKRFKAVEKELLAFISPTQNNTQHARN